jgi:hypothetical protein
MALVCCEEEVEVLDVDIDWIGLDWIGLVGRVANQRDDGYLTIGFLDLGSVGVGIKKTKTHAATIPTLAS